MVGVTDALYYSAHFGNGAVVAMNRGKPVEMAEVVPDSIEERLVNVACAPKPPRKPVRKIKKAKPSETKSTEVKPSEVKPAGTKPSETKSSGTKRPEAKRPETKPIAPAST
jgi:hypothetical protein